MRTEGFRGRRARLALRPLGAALIAAALVYAGGFAVNVLVGLAEPVTPTGPQWALIAAEGLFGLLLLAAGIVSLRCRTRRGLRGLGALAAAAAAALAAIFLLYPPALRSACEQYLASQAELAPGASVDRTCLAER